MKTGWQIRKLGEVCGFQNGFAFKSNLFRESGYPILRISNIQDEAVETDSLVYFRPEDYRDNLAKYQVLKGDLLIAMSGATTGKVGFNTTDQLFYLNQRVGKFEPKNCLLKQYLFYFLLTRVEENLSISAGAAQPNLSTEQIKEFEVPIPTLPEQQRIVGILDEAFDGIATAKANAEKNLQNARALFESHLQSVFTQRGEGWKRKPLGKICELISGQHIDAKAYNVEKKGVGYLTGPSDFGLLNPVVTKWTEHPKRMAKRGDILITVKGSGVGKINLLDVEEVAISRQLMAVRATITDVSYLYALLSTNYEYFQSISKGAAIPGISREDVLNLMCPMPPPDEQQAIVEIIQAVATETQRLESIYQSKLGALDELKKTLLHLAFSGGM